MLERTLKWMIDHGSDGAVARTRAGGLQFLFQGEVAPFTARTVKMMIESRMVEYVGTLPNKRLRVSASEFILSDAAGGVEGREPKKGGDA